MAVSRYWPAATSASPVELVLDVLIAPEDALKELEPALEADEPVLEAELAKPVLNAADGNNRKKAALKPADNKAILFIAPS